jgi:Protein kinase domain
VLQSVSPTLYCINPDCLHPLQIWGNKFCQSCGLALQLHGRYLPLRKLGTGGFAVTYVVHDLRTQSEQVLKVLTDPAPKAIKLFEQEAQVLASLHHPGIPHVDPDSFFRVQVGNSTPLASAGTARSLPCLVMEKINGQTLEALLEQHPQGCPEAWVVDWFQQAIDILQVLHQRQIIHRDLKPANLMLRQGSGQLVMIDFGGAKQMHLSPAAQGSSTRLFSPGYSPPEQIVGSNIQPATDFYALGRTLIHLLTGRYPAELEDPVTGELRWRDRIPVNTDLANLLDDLVRTDVQQRPATAEAIQSRLAPIAAVTTPSVPSNPFQTAQHQAAIALQQGIKAAQQLIATLITSLFKVIFWAFRALLDTFWSVLLAVIGASLGTVVGFAIAYQTSIGTRLAARLSQTLEQLLPNLQPAIGADFLIFALAGLGTAWGLTAAGGFGQRRRVWIAGLVGILGYLLGWVGLSITHDRGPVVGLTLFAAIAPTLLTLGLGLKHQPMMYGLVTMVGIAPCIAVLTALNVEFALDLWQLTATATNQPFWSCLSFFALFAGLLGGCLGFSHYLFIPFLRLIGWR